MAVRPERRHVRVVEVPHSDSYKVSLRELAEPDLPELQGLLESCADFLEFQDEEPVRSSAARDLLEDRPPGSAPQDKILLGISCGEVRGLAGVIDLILNRPGPGTVTLGLMLLDPDCRGQGIGASAYEQVEEWAKSRGAHSIKLGVLAGNDRGLSFWKSCGYHETGETGRYRSKSFTVLLKHIAGEARPSHL